MSLYPSFEDLSADHGTKNKSHSSGEGSRITHDEQPHIYHDVITDASHHGKTGSNHSTSNVYPTLDEYMGLNLKTDSNIQKLQLARTQQSPIQTSQLSTMVAPVSRKGILGLRRAEIRPGIRAVVLCKDVSGKLGLRIKAIHKGVFIAFVKNNSPAAYGGLRFGDQILQINNETLAGYNGDKVMKLIKAADPKCIKLAIRDRPFGRTITMQKDNVGRVGFMFKNGKVVALVKHSSASKNGLLTEQYICEINGQCVVGLKDKVLEDIIFNCGPTVTITFMPSYIYEHIVKSIGNILWKQQDHSIPDL